MVALACVPAAASGKPYRKTKKPAKTLALIY